MQVPSTWRKRNLLMVKTKKYVHIVIHLCKSVVKQFGSLQTLASNTPPRWNTKDPIYMYAVSHIKDVLG